MLTFACELTVMFAWTLITANDTLNILIFHITNLSSIWTSNRRSWSVGVVIICRTIVVVVVIIITIMTLTNLHIGAVRTTFLSSILRMGYMCHIWVHTWTNKKRYKNCTTNEWSRRSTMCNKLIHFINLTLNAILWCRIFFLSLLLRAFYFRVFFSNRYVVAHIPIILK